MTRKRKDIMSEDLKIPIDRLPPEMEIEVKELVVSLLKKARGEPKKRLRLDHQPGLLIKDLGWSGEQVEEARSRLASFEVDWDHPGMEKYDDL